MDQFDYLQSHQQTNGHEVSEDQQPVAELDSNVLQEEVEVRLDIHITTKRVFVVSVEGG